MGRGQDVTVPMSLHWTRGKGAQRASRQRCPHVPPRFPAPQERQEDARPGLSPCPLPFQCVTGPPVVPHPVPACSSPRTSPPAMRPAPTNPTQSSDASISMRGHAPRATPPALIGYAQPHPRSPIGGVAFKGRGKGARRGDCAGAAPRGSRRCTRGDPGGSSRLLPNPFQIFPAVLSGALVPLGPRRAPTRGVGLNLAWGKSP